MLSPDLILNNRALGFFQGGHPNKNSNNKMSSDMESVPDLTNPCKVVECVVVCICRTRRVFRRWRGTHRTSRV